ncbi:MAG: glycerophosphoryl diester phosphodiesterase [Actinomycetaceae bacterium]|nr:glycerophosphoryl diester phosphodiesterase [Actinomycetaceae bacterium]
MIEKTVFAHRGLNTLAPENTMAAFRLAHESGAKWIETDVDIISDGTIIICHDTTLDRTTDHSGGYYEMTASDIEKIDAGSWFSKQYAGEKLPTLRQLVDYMNETGLNANIEIKSNEAGAEMTHALIDGVIAELARLDGPEVIVSSFNLVLLYILKQKAPHLSIGALYETCALYDDWRSILELLKADYIHPEDTGLTRAKVKEFRDFGVGVNVWTVNSAERANELFNWGATGIFTDIAHQINQ